jgi:hypothetical protein
MFYGTGHRNISFEIGNAALSKRERERGRGRKIEKERESSCQRHSPLQDEGGGASPLSSKPFSSLTLYPPPSLPPLSLSRTNKKLITVAECP